MNVDSRIDKQPCILLNKRVWVVCCRNPVEITETGDQPPVVKTGSFLHSACSVNAVARLESVIKAVENREGSLNRMLEYDVRSDKQKKLTIKVLHKQK